MGKKSKVARSPTKDVPGLQEADMEQVSALREEGNKLFGQKEYQKALDNYDKASKFYSKSHPEVALLHSNKAACHMMLKRFKEAVQECSAALEVQPGYQKALIRRAKAYENLGLYKDALSDVQKAQRGDASTPETQEIERRLRDILSGKTKDTKGALARKAASSKGSSRMPVIFQAKITVDDDTRLLHLHQGVTYADLLEGVKEKFPDAGPVVLKYLDKEGDLVTITSRGDLQRAMQELVAAAEQLNSHGPKLPNSAMLPALRIVATKVASQADVPPPPSEEFRQMAEIREAQRRFAEAQLKQQKAKDEPTLPEGTVELDQWLVDFAQLFRDMLGVDADRHLDLSALGWEKCQQALETAVQAEEALPLFDKAAESFQEVTATGLFQWGNVHMCVGRRLIEKALHAGKPVDEVLGEVEGLFGKAEQRYTESLGFKPGFYDAVISLGQLYLEKGKLYSGMLVPPIKPEGEAAGSEGSKEGDAAKAPELSQEQLQKRQGEVLREVLGALDAGKARDADHWFHDAVQKYQEAVDALPEEERNKPIKPAEAGTPQPEEEIGLVAQAFVLWGNALYEQSQIRAAIGEEWKALLEEAEGKFRAAGCAEADIRNALKNHYRAEELDLGPDPEPQPAKEPAQANGTPAAAAAKEAGEQVKGLPALGPKPKKKEAAQAPPQAESVS